MPLTVEKVQQLDLEFKAGLKGIPLGNIICIAEAAWKAYKCETGTGQNCIKTLVTDIENCLK